MKGYYLLTYDEDSVCTIEATPTGTWICAVLISSLISNEGIPL